MPKVQNIEITTQDGIGWIDISYEFEVMHLGFDPNPPIYKCSGMITVWDDGELGIEKYDDEHDLLPVEIVDKILEVRKEIYSG